MKIFAAIFLLAALNLHADAENGIDVYTTNCANCHSTKMTGGMGKDFNLVSYERKKEDIIKYITEPSRMYREFGYSANAMPTIPLSADEVKDVADYIASLQPFKAWMKTK